MSVHSLTPLSPFFLKKGAPFETWPSLPFCGHLWISVPRCSAVKPHACLIAVTGNTNTLPKSWELFVARAGPASVRSRLRAASLRMLGRPGAFPGILQELCQLMEAAEQKANRRRRRNILAVSLSQLTLAYAKTKKT